MESKKIPTHIIYEKPFENTGLQMIRIEGVLSNLKLSTIIDRMNNIERTMNKDTTMYDFQVV